MIYEAFVAPTESPSTALEIKRALLTFEKVYIPDPGDRDLFPPQAFMSAMGMPPIMGINIGPVRPLGKTPDYDNRFDQLMSEIDIARRQGLIDVISSYDRSSSDQMTIGAVLMGNYPLNPRFMLWGYRNIARDNEVIRSAIAGDDTLFNKTDDEIKALAITQCSADGGINDDPAMLPLEGNLLREMLRIPLSSIARARLASVIKSIGFCAAKQMVPYFGKPSFASLAGRIALRANDVIDRVTTHDPFFASRAEVLRVAHEEYIDETILEKMAIDDVIALLTAAWGDQASARDEMLRSIAQLSKETSDKPSFAEVVRERIQQYRAVAEGLERERAKLKLQIRCEVVKAAGGIATGEGLSVGLLSQLQSAIGAATTLVAGCIYVADKIKDYAPVISQLKATEAQFKDDAAFGLHNFFARIDATTRA